MNFEHIIDSTICKFKVFCSEADFQLALAKELRNSYPSNTVRCEYYPGKYCGEKGNDIRIDIVISDDDCNIIPIELKYKTVEDKVSTDCGDFIVLKDQLAYNYACYDFWKDVERIEDLKTVYKSNMKNGFVVFLTNSTNYWQYDPSRKPSKYDDFRIYDKRKITSVTTLRWGGSLPADKTKCSPIALNGCYELDWRYHNIAGCVSYGSSAKNEKKYNYLVLEI